MIVQQDAENVGTGLGIDQCIHVETRAVACVDDQEGFLLGSVNGAGHPNALCAIACVAVVDLPVTQEQRAGWHVSLERFATARERIGNGARSEVTAAKVIDDLTATAAVAVGKRVQSVVAI